MRVPTSLPTASVISFPQRTLGSRDAPQFIFGQHVDFWALGGGSILLWAILLLADSFRDVFPPVQQRLAQISIVFSFLSLFINYPHFLISYRFGYGRGPRFVLKNWFALLFVPVLMTALFALAYECYSYDVSASTPLLILDQHLARIGIDLGIKYRGALGREILTVMIWLMYFTVGWHYSKQVFGCLMVYGKLKGYPFRTYQRHILKGNLFSVAIYQFLYMNRTLVDAGSSADPRFPGITLSGFELPSIVYILSGALLAASTLSSVAVFGDLFVRQKQKPDLTFLACWLSFLIWWIPVKNLPEFYVLAVPFFHSLQYLLFASKLEGHEIARHPVQAPRMIATVTIALIAGYAGFELLPVLLDNYLSTEVNQSAWFFLSAAGVFFNVHHFFIDSVVWRFHQPEVRRAFFSDET